MKKPIEPTKPKKMITNPPEKIIHKNLGIYYNEESLLKVINELANQKIDLKDVYFDTYGEYDSFSVEFYSKSINCNYKHETELYKNYLEYKVAMEEYENKLYFYNKWNNKNKEMEEKENTDFGSI
jgi:hypothetical protein